MSGLLSPSEVQSLFSGLDLSAGAMAARGDVSSTHDHPDDSDQFTLPLSLVPAERAGLEAWQAEFRDRWAGTCAEPLRSRFALRAAGVEVSRLKDFVTLHDGWHGFQVPSAQVTAPIWIVLDELLVGFHLDCLLGADGPAVSHTPGRRAWGPLEQQLTSRLINSLCESLLAHKSTEWTFKPIHSAADWIAGLPVYLSCELVRLQFEVACSELIGRLSIGIPRSACASLFLTSAGGPSPNSDQAVTLRATLPPISLTAAEFHQLQVGDVLLTSQGSQMPCQISLDGQLRFEASIGSHQGHKAVRLTDGSPHAPQEVWPKL